MEAKLAASLHPAARQWASGSNEGLDTEEASLHEPPCGTRLEANSATGGGRVGASGWLLEAKTSEPELQEAQRG